MFRTFRYRLYPNKDQAEALGEILWIACWLYNRALDYRRKKWRESREAVRYSQQSAMWREWRNEEPAENPLRQLNMSAGQQVLRRLESSYRQFVMGKRGRPRFKKVSRFSSVNYKPGDGASIKNNRLYVQNVGLVRVRMHRKLPNGKLKNIIIKRKSSGWYVLLQIELPEQTFVRSSNAPVGVDMGIMHALALSDGTIIDSPKFLELSLIKLRVLQRSLARKKRGGSNWRKTKHQIACLHERISNQRLGWWHKVTRRLVDTYGMVAIEDLQLSFILRNDKLALAAHDIGLGMFRTLLDYKAIEAGVEVILVNPRGTSKACSGCGSIVEKSLKDRIYRCHHCGLVLDRDVNAAKNILELGRSSWELTWSVGTSVSQEATLLYRGELSHRGSSSGL